MKSTLFNRFVFAATLAVSSAAMGQTNDSKELAVMGRIAWSAFECSSLAAQMKDTKEQERLFMLGYDQGKRFIEAAQGGKIDRQDIRGEVPIGLTMLLQGPTPDFMLGRVYESTQDAALKDVLRTNGNLNSDDVQALLARNKYTEQNCRLLRANSEA